MNWVFYDLTYGPQNVPLMDQNMSKRRMHLNGKQYNHRLSDTSAIALQNATVEEKCTEVAAILASQIYNYITIATNNCEYSETMEELIVSYIYPLF